MPLTAVPGHGQSRLELVLEDVVASSYKPCEFCAERSDGQKSGARQY